MRLIARLLTLSLPLLFSLPSLAATVSDLYEVREAGASQQPDQRNTELGRALDTLVLRLTGKANGSKNPDLAETYKDPQQIVTQYGFEGDSIVVSFDPASTDNALRQAGLPIWSANRPAVMTWWLNEDINGTSLVGDGLVGAEPLNRAAQHRGLPLRLPLADLSEQLVGTAENLSAKSPDELRTASERYAADALLAVQASESDGAWNADWRLWIGNDDFKGSAQGADQAAVADSVMMAVSELLAKRFVAAAGTSTDLTLEIEGAGLAQYAEIQRILEPFDSRFSKVDNGRLVFKVKANAEQLRSQLALAQLQEVPATADPEPEVVDSQDASGQDSTASGESAVEGTGESTAPQAPAPQSNVPKANVLRFRW
ncbi:DUF2066 domain-containing protein [Pseudomonas sp. M30-35]|uniref:DUF2066 domain-containing protein n=1 Tax=Pseudomonas sp. M30-35 TaxID=1981174 RepID=UPI000B3CB216|nr:DUF2066 domain-containing protein [Pseudomonas sp. M30-35]ARU87793.1 hypothetical protein B9K09_07365 [Pseudomonas sp. M30-35]